jgi:hypothetical protein
VNTHAALDSSTALALERTRLAHERRLMAWVRTATSLISFGFTIYKAFEYLRQRQPDVAHVRVIWLKVAAISSPPVPLLSTSQRNVCSFLCAQQRSDPWALRNPTSSRARST